MLSSSIRKKTKALFSIATLLFFHSLAHAHGENKPGPHHGFIRMPGAFHTEVVPHKDGFEILLLDIHFQHPTTKNSTVKAAVTLGKQSVALKCKPNVRSFFCAADKNLLKQASALEVTATRETSQGRTVIYTLPLSYE
ncbi:MAG: hypothetical protein KIT56_06785 [Gammaproteobacteria bacterium]|nr:hypothetical protein [Gammaproteobacteria bacterium]